MSHTWYEAKLNTCTVNILNKRIFKEGVLEPKVSFKSLAPSGFVIKIHICTLFKLIRSYLRFFVTLKPSHILFMVTPVLLLQLPRRQILLISSLSVVKYEKECIRVHLLKDSWIFKNIRRGRWE